MEVSWSQTHGEGYLPDHGGGGREEGVRVEGTAQTTSGPHRDRHRGRRNEEMLLGREVPSRDSTGTCSWCRAVLTCPHSPSKPRAKY